MLLNELVGDVLTQVSLVAQTCGKTIYIQNHHSWPTTFHSGINKWFYTLTLHYSHSYFIFLEVVFIDRLRCNWFWLIHWSIALSNLMTQSCSLNPPAVQWILSGTTTLDVKKRRSFQTGGRSRQVQFAWNPIDDRNFQKSENGRCRQVSLYKMPELLPQISWLTLNKRKWHFFPVYIHDPWLQSWILICRSVHVVIIWSDPWP